ncbi:hypothetical protein AM588_10006081 [Phytophthora nicotianae]|uniref:Acyltransferase n=1 Tax=Phytophthora nicotianae TaxID=4792 RepID=A0A0W8DFT8_PHYNI|nr:hypothetical protein AM588_10006081 [Phytophthora nicotianae]
MKIIREQELDPNKRYIFGFHPHGIIVLSRIAIFGGSFEDVFPGITYRILGASPMFYIPLGRELCLWMGGVDASRSTGEKVLKEGSSIVVYPGGVSGIFKTNPNSKETQLVLKNRLGFVKLAMNHGADLVPTFVFGEKWLYNGAQKTGKGNVWESLRTSSIWGLMNKFLRIKIIREQELDPKKQYIFGFHPHGIIVLSRLAIFGRNFDDVFPGIKNRLSLSTQATQLVLKKRLGFIKLAMRHGADLIPTFIFGEKWLYNMWNPPRFIINFFRKALGIPVLVFWGKFWWMPKAPAEGKRYGLVYGKPIVTKHTPNPTDEEIRAVHAQYVAEIERIFKQYKSEFGYEEDETLLIV